MRLTTGWGTLAAALTVLLAMSGALLAAPVTARDGSSSIEIHNRICPPNYAGGSHFDDCHGTPSDAGIPFTFAGDTIYERPTNAEGNAGLANLPAGTYTITAVPPIGLVDRVAHCSIVSGDDGSETPIDVTYVDSGIQLELPADANVICDWYNVPAGEPEAPTETATETGAATEAPTEVEAATATDTETAVVSAGSIEVHNRVCPPESEGQPAFDACHGNVPEAGLPFTFAGPITLEGVTNAEGNVGFGNLPEGTYAITADATAGFADRFVYCSVGTAETSNEAPIAVEYVTGGIQIDLPAATNVICDWYDYPIDTATDEATTPPADGTREASTERAEQGAAESTATPDDSVPEATEVAAVSSDDVPSTQLHRAGLFPASCDDLVGSASEYLLNDLVGTAPETAGADGTMPVEMSTTTLPIPLDELIAAGYSLVIFYDDDASGTALPVACAEIAGFPGERAGLELELQETDDSGFAGIANLAPASSDPVQTEISTFPSPVASDGDTEAEPTT